MIYKDFCIVPESDLDERFIEDEMTFLLEISVLNPEQFENVQEYKDAVRNRYANWMMKSMSTGG